MKIFLIILLTASFTFSQWQAGASFKIKKDIPEKGIGVHLNRNLPFQGATFGIKVRGELNLFRQTETKITDGESFKQKSLSEDFNLNITGNYFFRNFSPYFGFGIGYEQIHINQVSSRNFLLMLMIGLSIPINFIHPFIEIHGVNYFSDFNSAFQGRNISSFQFRGSAGISFSINTIK